LHLKLWHHVLWHLKAWGLLRAGHDLLPERFLVLALHLLRQLLLELQAAHLVHTAN
jgi:hypothetical protein